jgi:hypothetical protein
MRGVKPKLGQKSSLRKIAHRPSRREEVQNWFLTADFFHDSMLSIPWYGYHISPQFVIAPETTVVPLFT